MNSGIELRDRSYLAPSSSSSSTFRPALAVPSASVSASGGPPSFIMKPLVSAMQAWSCVVISAFAIIILSVLGLLFKNNHHEMVGGAEDPEDGPAVAATIFMAVLVYVGFLVFCGLQAALHLRESRRGAIAL